MNAIYILDLLMTNLLEHCKKGSLVFSPLGTLIHLKVSSVWASADKSWHCNSSVKESVRFQKFQLCGVTEFCTTLRV